MRYITLKGNRKYIFDNTKIMGIINSTPDSFYEGSRTYSNEMAIGKAMKMIEEGASFIDVGGESTRPGAIPISVEEEIKRVVPVIEGIKRANKDILISIDTYRSIVAEEAINAGADIINDISSMTFDENMAAVAFKYNVPIILMHIKGTPRDMQKNPVYKNVIEDVTIFFKERINFALTKGIDENKIILDPGIGFGKLYEHNIELIKNINEFKILNMPILLGASRKSFIGTAIGMTSPEERLEGTIAVTCYAALNGVEIVRVHDVLENTKAAKMIEVLR
jgi:dihydropteroate synthase